MKTIVIWNDSYYDGGSGSEVFDHSEDAYKFILKRLAENPCPDDATLNDRYQIFLVSSQFKLKTKTTIQDVDFVP